VNDADPPMLELLSRTTHLPLETVRAHYRREVDALAQDATVTNYVTLLAVRRLRNQLLRSPNGNWQH
jgi:Protein of unknown function (DUF3562)